MGWADCGIDTGGRPIGYVFEATCDHPGCVKQIDRGLDFACGGMHGEDEYSCEKYFCWDHRQSLNVECISGTTGAFVCAACVKIYEEEHFPECRECRIANTKENDVIQM